ncbi:TonB-dependent heme/hemoglobin receptor family protein [Tardiphaga alba]|uniref:TonB-dependent heme/hemoglobin receptor family protein n=1 Tax=Tardiphaga alba TaxID=340268 RepID=A0ABX8A810_9BRAD|nr:TonB-dependent receptor [Tardiphaga alba]QUS39441.1 TonB-dependent heme/hemoglobin receptor family protein [Tardiphaga alba]
MSVNNNRSASGMLAGCLFATTALVLSGTVVPVHAQQTSATLAQKNFNIGAQSLAVALTQFGRQSGLQVSVSSAAARGRSSPGVSGTLTPDQALSQLLSGTGMQFRFSDSGTVVISANDASSASGAVSAANGEIQLDTIEVSGARVSSSDAPYQTPAPVTHISEQSIERFRGSSPADMFRGTPGVMSGESRNGAGSIDVNIRGMQGFGRVATTVDGAENATSVYQGYQGVSNRTFVDPDLLAGIDIQKGSDAASRGIAGSVAMRTLSADDIIKPGNNWGVRVKGGFGTNSATLVPGAVAGYNMQNIFGGQPIVTASPTGLDRPGFLEPTNGSGSAVVAVREEGYDLLAAYAYRKRGNYFAGSKGETAQPVNTGPRPNYPGYVENAGLANYRPGEEVLNTQMETQSWLTKATLRFDDEKSIQFGYSGFRSEAGDLIASLLPTNSSQAQQNGNTAGAKVDTLTARYQWKPSDNALIDLKANMWMTYLELRNPRRGRSLITPESISLPATHRTGSDAQMWGADATNTSRFSLDSFRALALTYGVSYLSEDTNPTPYASVLDAGFTPRDGERHEAATFTKVAYNPVDWLTLNGGLRYSMSRSHDRAIPANINTINVKPNRTDDGFSPSAGVTIEPVKGAQFYVNYSNALRFPSLAESVSAFSLTANPNVGPERASNWEIGSNLVKDGVMAHGDKAMLKFQYFNWDVKDYIARAFTVLPDGTQGMQIFNIDRAKFAGLELSSRYENNGFTIDAGANYYLDVAYCQRQRSCDSRSLYGDFATNFIPPKYSANVTVSQKLLDDALTIGGRATYIGPRAIAHGQATSQGLGQFISLVDWRPYWLIDTFADYKINQTWTAGIRVENLLDQYYVDPLGLVQQPGPGRTFYATLTGTLGNSDPLPRWHTLSGRSGATAGRTDWTGLYAGGHVGSGAAQLQGITTDLDGSTNGISPAESANQDLRSLLFGGQVGFNYQFANRMVVGLEADWSRSLFKGQQSAFITQGGLAGTGNLEAKMHYDIDWLSTLRARVGYALDNNLLVYATGGVAVAHETQSRDQYRSDVAGSAAPDGNVTNLFAVEQLSMTRTGFTVGFGGEYAINDRWSIKAEYGYVHFPKKSAQFRNARAGTGRAYSSIEQVGATPMPSLPDQYPGDPDVIDYCTNIDPSDYRCQPYDEPIYGNVNHTGASNVVKEREASSSLGAHSLKIGLNYRF